jgi:transglutaminase-like putative cysteine protease
VFTYADGQKLMFTVGSFLAPQALTFFVELEDASARTAEGAAARADTSRAPPQYQVMIKLADNGMLNVGREVGAFRQRGEEVPRESMQALDVALRQGASLDPGNKLLGRGVYTPQDAVRLGFGLEAVSGFGVQNLAGKEYAD